MQKGNKIKYKKSQSKPNPDSPIETRFETNKIGSKSDLDPKKFRFQVHYSSGSEPTFLHP